MIHIKNMLCSCCKVFLQEIFEDSGITVHEMSLGKARISYDHSAIDHEFISGILNKYGFNLLVNKQDKLVSDIKIAVIELIHHLNNVNYTVRKSDYIVEKLSFSYPYLSNQFKKNTRI